MPHMNYNYIYSLLQCLLVSVSNNTVPFAKTDHVHHNFSQCLFSLVTNECRSLIVPSPANTGLHGSSMEFQTAHQLTYCCQKCLPVMSGWIKKQWMQTCHVIINRIQCWNLIAACTFKKLINKRTVVKWNKWNCRTDKKGIWTSIHRLWNSLSHLSC